jgi:uncharacterized membrane protein YadS
MRWVISSREIIFQTLIGFIVGTTEIIEQPETVIEFLINPLLMFGVWFLGVTVFQQLK